MSLIFLSLGLFSPPPAHAQMLGSGPLVPCDANGNVYNYSPDSQGFYYLQQGKEQGTITLFGTYGLMKQYGMGTGPYTIMSLYAAPVGSNAIAPHYMAGDGHYGGAFISVDTLSYGTVYAPSIACNILGSMFMPSSTTYTYQTPDKVWHTMPVNGEITGDVKGQLLGYFKCAPASGYGATAVYPTTVTVIVRTTLSAATSLTYFNYVPPAAVPYLLATATASIASLNEGVASPSPPITVYQPMQFPVNPTNGVVTVNLGNGEVTLYVVNNATAALCGAAAPSATPTVSAAVKAPAVTTLIASCINKDTPIATSYNPISNGGIVYGGSVRFTSDELLLNAADPNPVPGTTYTWYNLGAGASVPPSGGSAWNVVIPPTPGIATYACLVQTPGVPLPTIKQLTVEVGIRTDDTILVGWIDATGVQLTGGGGTEALAAGVDPAVVYEFAPGTLDLPGTPGGAPGSDSNFPFFPPAAAAGIVELAKNDDYMDYASLIPSHVYSLADRDYILDWMFKYSANTDPTVVLQNLQTPDWTIPMANWPLPTWNNPNPVPVNTSSDFTCYAGYMDYLKYQAYLANNKNFKLVNHFQVKYRVSLTNPTQFNGAPIVLQHDAVVGGTINPTGIPPDVGPFLDSLAALPGIQYFDLGLAILLADKANNALLNPQYGPANGLIGPTPATDHISQVNDGSPDIFAIRAFNTLMALDMPNPLFWQNIGSKITFKCGSATPVYQLPENYPTYYQYQNGLKVLTFVQAASPKGHFYANAYPFGEYPSYGLPPALLLGFPTIPGGRNGVATTPGDGSSPTPLYTVP